MPLPWCPTIHFSTASCERPFDGCDVPWGLCLGYSRSWCISIWNPFNRLGREFVVKWSGISRWICTWKISRSYAGPNTLKYRFLNLRVALSLHMSSVIYFRHNDMQDCVIKLGKWYRTAVAEARGRLFVFFFGGSSRKQMLCNRFLHIVHSLDISFLYLKILAMRSWPSRKYRNCMLKVHFVVGNLRKLCGRSAEAPRKG